LGCRPSLGNLVGQQLLLVARQLLAAPFTTAAEVLHHRLQLQLNCQMMHLIQQLQGMHCQGSSSSRRRCQYPLVMGPAAVQVQQAGWLLQALAGPQLQQQHRLSPQQLHSCPAVMAAPAASLSSSHLRQHLLCED
jgi:hypothetical protein